MKRTSVAIIVLCCLPLFLAAGDFKLFKGGVAIWFPDNWHVQYVNDNALIAAAPDGDIFCRLDLIPTLNDYPRVVAYDFSGFRPIQSEPVVEPAGRNGMPFRYMQGPASRHGQNWNLSLDFYKVAKGTVLFVYGMQEGADGKYAGFSGELRRMSQSIRLDGAAAVGAPPATSQGPTQQQVVTQAPEITAGAGRDFVLAKAGVSVGLPAQWRIQEMANGSLRAESPDGSTYVRFDLVPPGSDAAMVIADDFSDIRIIPGNLLKQVGRSGLAGKNLQATAMRGGQRWVLGFDLLDVPQGTLAYVFGRNSATPAKKVPAIQAEVARIRNSIKVVSVDDGW